MGRRRRQENKTPQKTNSNSIEDLLENKGTEYSVADLSKMRNKYVQ
jgi:hypothetical protein